MGAFSSLHWMILAGVAAALFGVHRLTMMMGAGEKPPLGSRS